MSAIPAAAAPSRIPWIDRARTAALLAMAVFHAGRDMEVLGLWPPGSTFGGTWDLSARAIAGSFVFLAGLSLWLAHGQGVRWRGFGKRMGILVLAALAVSVGTYLFAPAFWVRFGILHSIALCSVLSLPFLRAPWWLTAAVAGAILWWGPGTDLPAFDGAAWVWTGLSRDVPPMMDWEPVVPWLAPMLLGVAAGRLGGALGLWARLAQGPHAAGPLARALAWPGRHSLAIYLLHQPLIVGAILGWTWLVR